MTESVLIIGTGLIGGSIGLSLRKEGTFVRGYDATAEHADLARDAGAIDDAARDIASAAEQSEVVVIATPVGEILPTIEELASCAKPGTIVTDVGSTKATIVREAERLLGPRRPFVGGHPMAGTEGEGISSARPDLFSDALWILTPTDQTDSAAYRRINGLVSRLGARTLALDPEEHDRLVALVSHLPYAIATTLMALAGREGDERVFRTAAGSFRDVTRTAGSNPRIWRDVFATNRVAIVRELDSFIATIERFRTAISDERWEEIDALVADARAARKRFPAKGERTPARPVIVEVAVPDRTGVFADVTTAMGEGGINIEDLWVDHTPTGGVFRIVVDGTETAVRAAEILERRGYRTTTVEER